MYLSYIYCIHADIDECKTPNKCPAKHKCVNMPGFYECPCKDGYEKGDGDECVSKYHRNFQFEIFRKGLNNLNPWCWPDSLLPQRCCCIQSSFSKNFRSYTVVSQRIFDPHAFVKSEREFSVTGLVYSGAFCTSFAGIGQRSSHAQQQYQAMFCCEQFSSRG